MKLKGNFIVSRYLISDSSSIGDRWYARLDSVNIMVLAISKYTQIQKQRDVSMIVHQPSLMCT